MEYALNNIIVRIIVGITVGSSITAIALIGGAHGLVLGYAGIINAEFGLTLFGILTITGFIGICGAWCRLLKPTYSMSQRFITRIRYMLFFGLVTSAILSIWALYIEGLTVITMPLLALTLGCILFIMGTPKSSNKAFKRDAEKASRPLT
jgi:hypothetical protein